MEQQPPQDQSAQQQPQQPQQLQGAEGFPQMDPNGINQNGMNPNDMSHLGNGFMNPDAMAGLMQGQGFMGDAAMGGMPMGIPDNQLMMNMMMANGAVQPNGISADDIALYDRQIRLWGVAAQAKIQNANILLITIKALGNEVAKNLVLAGVGSLTILDDATVTEADLGAQFFLSEEDNLIGQNRAQAASAAIQRLNPRVQVHVDTEGSKSKGASYFAAYDVVIATDLDPGSFNIINTTMRLNGRPFYAACSHGMYGFIFSDLIEHDFVIERDVGNIPTTPKQETRTRSIIDVQTKTEGTKTVEHVTKRELYSTWMLASEVAGLPADIASSVRRRRKVSPALSCLRALWTFMEMHGRVPGNREDLKMFTQLATQKHKALNLPSETLTPEFLRSFLQNLGSEIAPVTAILGGQLAQDVINVLGQKEQPIQNMVIFDGTTMEALMYPLHPEGVIGAELLSLNNDPMSNGGAPAGGDINMMNGMGGMGFDPTMGGMAMGGMPMGGMPNQGVPMGGMPAEMPQQMQVDQPSNGNGSGSAPAQAPAQAEQAPAVEEQPKPETQEAPKQDEPAQAAAQTEAEPSAKEGESKPEGESESKAEEKTEDKSEEKKEESKET